MRETRAAAALRRACYEVGLARDRCPDTWNEKRFERVVKMVTENILSRGEDWRDWVGEA